MPNRTPSTPDPNPENQRAAVRGERGAFAGLRLRRDDAERTENSGLEAGAASFKFPAPGVHSRVRATRGGRLVAAQVSEAPVERSFEGSPCAVLNGGDDPDCVGRIVSSRQLVKEIESTLDRMQSRLTDFRGELDRAFRFPTGDDELPPAA